MPKSYLEMFLMWYDRCQKVFLQWFKHGERICISLKSDVGTGNTHRYLTVYNCRPRNPIVYSSFSGSSSGSCPTEAEPGLQSLLRAAVLLSALTLRDSI